MLWYVLCIAQFVAYVTSTYGSAKPNCIIGQNGKYVVVVVSYLKKCKNNH